MAWQDEMTTIVRYLIDDVDSPVTYSDSRVQQTILVAAQQVQDCLTFPKDYTINIPASGLTPDPTSATRDDAFINLVSLKTACLFDRAKFTNAISQGIKIKDGSSSIDTTGSFGGYQFILKEGNCKDYEDAKLQYQIQGANGTAPGEAIIGPYRALYYQHHNRSDRC